MVVLTSSSMFLKRGFFWPPEMISKDCTMGTPEAIMVAIWRLKTATSRGLTRLPVEPNSGLGFSRTVCGFMPWRRSSALTSEAFLPDISPFMRLPRLSSATHSYTDSLVTEPRAAPVLRDCLVAMAVAMLDPPIWMLPAQLWAICARRVVLQFAQRHQDAVGAAEAAMGRAGRGDVLRHCRSGLPPLLQW